MLFEIQELVDYLEDAGIDPSSQNVEALQGMLSLGVFPVEICIADLKNFISKGVRWV